MTTFLQIAGFLAFLLLWSLAWRNKPKLGFGLFIGVGIGWVIAAAVLPLGSRPIPPWLPALPFAVVAISLFVFGALAWLWGREQ
jgi:hypothetical protein